MQRTCQNAITRTYFRSRKLSRYMRIRNGRRCKSTLRSKVRAIFWCHSGLLDAYAWYSASCSNSTPFLSLVTWCSICSATGLAMVSTFKLPSYGTPIERFLLGRNCSYRALMVSTMLGSSPTRCQGPRGEGKDVELTRTALVTAQIPLRGIAWSTARVAALSLVPSCWGCRWDSGEPVWRRGGIESRSGELSPMRLAALPPPSIPMYIQGEVGMRCGWKCI